VEQSQVASGSCGCFWFQSAGADAAVTFWKGVGIATVVTGEHANLASGSNIDKIAHVLGPRYTYALAAHHASLPPRMQILISSGTLKGTGPRQIAFLRELLKEIGAEGGGRIGLEAIDPVYYLAAKRNANDAMFWYFDFHQPSYFDFSLPEEAKLKAEWGDPWEMTTKAVDGLFTGKSRIKLPVKPYQAIVFRKV
jgi:Domain of unknown function (DUF5605)